MSPFETELAMDDQDILDTVFADVFVDQERYVATVKYVRTALNRFQGGGNPEFFDWLMETAEQAMVLMWHSIRAELRELSS